MANANDFTTDISNNLIDLCIYTRCILIIGFFSDDFENLDNTT